MEQSDFERVQRFLHVLKFLGHGLDILFCVRHLHPWIYHIGLTSAGELVANEIEHLRELGSRSDKCLDGAAACRQLIHDGNVQIAIERQPERARNGRRREHEEVGVTALAHQRFTLGHAELVLFINDDQPEVGQIKTGGEQGVSAYRQG